MRPVFPPGHHTVEDMAQHFKMTKIALYRRLRELGILHTDPRKDQKFGRHNHIQQYYIKKGWGYMSESVWQKKSDTDNNQYTIGLPVFYQKGFDAIKKIIIDGEELPPLNNTALKEAEKEPAPKKEELKNDFRTNHSREAALKNLRDFNII